MHKYLVWCAFLLVAAFLGFALTGCLRTAESNEPNAGQTPKALTKSTPSPEESTDVRIISLDFDPPINQDSTFTGFKNRILMVAVDNRGKKTQGDVVVTLEIRNSAGTQPLVSQIQTVSSLASGEVKVLKFAGFSELPDRPTYDIVVEVKPVIGEIDLSNNNKSLTLHLVNQ